MKQEKKKKLTEVGIKNLKPPAKGQIEIPDGQVAGLLIRVGTSGKKAWSFRYRYGTKERKLGLGHYPEVSLKDARDKAREAKQLIQRGLDPKEEAKRTLFQREESYALTLARLADKFMHEHERGPAHYANPETEQPNLRDWKETERLLDKYILPPLGHIPASDISRADIRAMLKSAGTHSESQANKVFATIRKIYNWAMGCDLVENSPCAGLKKPYKSKVRTDWLDDEKIEPFWQACLEEGYPFGDAFRFLLITGQRRSEVFKMTWDEISFSHKEWKLDPSRTKAKREHIVPLSPLAIQILKELPRTKGAYVFSCTFGERPISCYKRPIRKIREEFEVGHFLLHDLRRTAGTIMRSRLSVSKDVVGQVLNHAPQGVTQIHYASVPSLTDKRAALNKWDAYLQNLLYAGQPNNIISFPVSKLVGES